MTTAIIYISVAGYLLIAMESLTKVNKMGAMVIVETDSRSRCHGASESDLLSSGRSYTKIPTAHATGYRECVYL